MIEPTICRPTDEDSGLIESFMQDQVDDLLNRTRGQAETDAQQAVVEQTENEDVNAA